MKKLVFILWVVIVALYSCKQDTNWHETSFFDWRPRKVNNVFIAMGYRTYYTWYGNDYTDYHDFEGDTINSSFFLSVLTSNHNPILIWEQEYPDLDVKTRMPIYYLDDDENISEYLDAHDPNIEQQIQRDYDKNIGHTNGKGLSYDNMIKGEYRLTEITNLKIFTLNTRLFGKNAGESLNDFFDIIAYDLPVIFTAPTERLVYGCGSTDMPTSIDEWLSVQPLAQATMWLSPNTPIPETLPLNVQFVVEMTTKEGKVLRDTTQMVTLIK